MKFQGKNLDLRLFIEGIETPVSSVRVQSTVNAPSTAAIVIPPCSAVHEFKPRLLVHVFYFHTRYESVVKGDKPNVVYHTDKSDPIGWRLLFVGEVHGYSFSSQGGQRFITLNCKDLSAYWQDAKLYWGPKNTSIEGYRGAAFIGATHLYKGTARAKSSDDLLKILTGPCSSMPSLPGLLGGLLSLLESAVGVFDPGGSGKEKARGISDFLSQAELRLHLTRMLGASEKDDTSAVFFNASSFERFLTRVSQQQRSTSSYMELLNVLLSKMYHIWHPVLAPSYLPHGAALTYKTLTPLSGDLQSEKDIAYWYGIALALYKRVTKELGEADARRSEANMSGSGTAAYGIDFVTSEAISVEDSIGGISRDKEAVQRHQSFSSFMVANFLAQAKTAPESGSFDRLGDIISARIMEKTKNSANADTVKTAFGHLEAAAEYGRVILHGGKCGTAFGGGPSYSSICQHTGEHYRRLQGELDKAINGLSGGVPRPTKVVTATKGAASRLTAFLFHPDIWMVPPPRCNVLFPEQVQSIGYNRSWVEEVTRMILFGRTESGNNTKDYYFAPNASTIGSDTSGSTAKSAELAVKEGANFLMSHELFTGIIPSMQGLGDMDIFKKIHTKTLKELKSEAGKKKGPAPLSDKEIIGESAYAAQPHMQRAVNYMFFSERYASRSMSVVCRFTPQLIVGLPALVMDTAAKEDTSNARHYLGEIVSLQHSIDSAGGAQTQLLLSKCRVHTEGPEVFGGVGADGKIHTARGKENEFRTEVKPTDGKASFFIPVEVTTDKKVTIDNSQNAIRLAMGGAVEPDVHYEVESRKDDLTESDVIRDSNMTGIPHKGAVLAKVYKSGKHTKMEGDIAFDFESSLTPPWLSSIYHTGNVGADFYNSLLGCYSVVDSTSLQSSLRSTATATATELTYNGADRRVSIPNTAISTGVSAKQAADSLATLWSSLRKADADMELFIDTYTDRPIATLVDMFGAMCPFLRESTKYLDGRASRQDAVADQGFHRDAFGMYIGLEGIKPEPLQTSDSKSVKRAIDSRVDTRYDKYLSVIEYTQELGSEWSNGEASPG